MYIWRFSEKQNNYIIYKSFTNWQAVETISECFPQLDVVPSLTFIVETIYSAGRRNFYSHCDLGIHQGLVDQSQFKLMQDWQEF